MVHQLKENQITQQAGPKETDEHALKHIEKERDELKMQALEDKKTIKFLQERNQ